MDLDDLEEKMNEDAFEHITNLFDEYSDEDYIKFERVENKRSSRPDIHAFIFLNELVPGEWDMVCSAEHDKIWLDVNIHDLIKAGITDEQVLELVRCGVSNDGDGLYMFT